MLLYDAKSAHTFLDVVRMTVEQNISIICLPGKTTAFLQSVDQILSVLTNKFSQIALNCSYTKYNFLVRPGNFVPVLKQAITAAWDKKTVRFAFERAGKDLFTAILNNLSQYFNLIKHDKKYLMLSFGI